MKRIVSAAYNRCTGLGNKLFPWARAKIYAKRYACPMLASIWMSPHGGAITRGGIDYSRVFSTVLLAGNFRNSPEEMSLLKYAFFYSALPKFYVNELADAERIVDDGHLIFNSLKCFDFTDFAGEQGFLRRSLEEITRPRYLSFVQKFANQDYIGINIRAGKDFVSKSADPNSAFVRTEQSWYCSALQKIRLKYGDMPAIVCSDGGEDQLSQILKEPRVSLLNSPAAITDLLVLSKAKVLLGCGNSSFSTWASFLGEMDTFSSPDTPFRFSRGLENGRNGEKIVSVL